MNEFDGPEEWNVSSLKGVCEFIKDGTHHSPKSQDGPYKYVTSKNIKNGVLDLSDISYISEEEHNEIYKRCPVRYGDVLLTKDGANTGNVAMNWLDEPYSLLSSVAVMRTQPESLEATFLYQLLSSPLGQKTIKNSMSGQAITRITLKKLAAYEFPFPPLPEQKKIAAILSSVDDAIAKTKAVIEQTKKLKKGMMQKLLTRGIGHTKFKQTEIGELPESWNVVTFGSVLKKEMPPITMDDNEAYGPLTVMRRHNGIEVREWKKGSKILVKQQFKTVPGTFVISKRQIIHGSCGIMPEGLDGAIISKEYMAYLPTDKLDIRFLDHYSHSPLFQKTIVKTTYGVDIEKFVFKDKWWEKELMPLPSMTEQKRICDALDSVETRISKLQEEMGLKNKVKQALMQQLLTGKVRV